MPCVFLLSCCAKRPQPSVLQRVTDVVAEGVAVSFVAVPFVPGADEPVGRPTSTGPAMTAANESGASAAGWFLSGADRSARCCCACFRRVLLGDGGSRGALTGSKRGRSACGCDSSAFFLAGDFSLTSPFACGSRTCFIGDDAASRRPTGAGFGDSPCCVASPCETGALLHAIWADGAKTELAGVSSRNEWYRYKGNGDAFSNYICHPL